MSTAAIEAKLDQLGKDLATLTNMVGSLIVDTDDRRSKGESNRKAAFAQMDAAKTAVLDNPIFKTNPAMKKAVEGIFASVPGGSS